MSTPIVRCRVEGPVATVVMDDGGNNLISLQMIQELNGALDQAEKVQAVVVLTGRGEIFCAGFDLKILKTGILNAFRMIMGGFSLSVRLLSFPTPVVVACNGHAVAMGAFLLLSGDDRIGAEGSYKICTNEVAIGLAMPSTGIELCRQRLAPAHFSKAALLAESYGPEGAVEAGFLDRIVPAEELLQEANALALQLAELDFKAHFETKIRARKQLLKTLAKAMRSDRLYFIQKGIERILRKK